MPDRMMGMNLYCLIVAGGRGTRMNAVLPKQFLPLAGMPVLMHTVRAFRSFRQDIPIILVLPDDQTDTWNRLCREYRFDESVILAPGGETRWQSVKNGLDRITEDGLVAIHDGVRPLILPETVGRLFAEAGIHGCAVPAVPPSDSLRRQEGDGSRVIDRGSIRLIQTPQVFSLNKLKEAYVMEYRESFTDDASVWEAAGNRVHLAEGQYDNIKITRPEDLILAEGVMNARSRQPR